MVKGQDTVVRNHFVPESSTTTLPELALTKHAKASIYLRAKCGQPIVTRNSQLCAHRVRHYPTSTSQTQVQAAEPASQAAKLSILAGATSSASDSWESTTDRFHSGSPTPLPQLLLATSMLSILARNVCPEAAGPDLYKALKTASS